MQDPRPLRTSTSFIARQTGDIRTGERKRAVHACPGAPLARLELTVLVEELLAATISPTAAEGTRSVYATYPAGGFSEVSVSLVRS